MSITMNMSSYEIDQASMEEEYGTEIMCAGWNPAVDLMCQQMLLIPTERQKSMPVDLSEAIADLFLEKMHAYRR